MHEKRCCVLYQNELTTEDIQTIKNKIYKREINYKYGDIYTVESKNGCSVEKIKVNRIVKDICFMLKI